MLRHWEYAPPVALSARVIAQIMGAKFERAPKPSASKELNGAAVQSLTEAGFAPMEGRPKDPMLDLLIKTL